MAPGGLVYHVLNRSAGNVRLFRKDADFEVFERILIEAYERHPIRILSYCFMPKHWQFVVWPETDEQVTSFFRWLAQTHAMRFRVSNRTVGEGHLYQGRFKSFPVQRDEHLLNLCRYVERSPLTAGLVRKSQLWRFSSLWARLHDHGAITELLSPLPVKRPADWTDRVNAAMTAEELDRLRVSFERGRPYGGDAWVRRTVTELHLEHTVRPEGRPKKLSTPAVRKKN